MQNKRSIVKFKHEDPNDKQIYRASIHLNSEEKKIWIFVKEHIQNDDDLRKRYGYDPEKRLSNSKICKIMISYMHDLYNDKERLLGESIKDLEKSLIIDRISLLDKELSERKS